MTDIQKTREQLHRLIIENQSEDGSIDRSDQSAMADEILELMSQIHAQALTALLEAMPEKLKQKGVWNKEPYFFEAIGFNEAIDLFTAIIEGMRK